MLSIIEKKSIACLSPLNNFKFFMMLLIEVISRMMAYQLTKQITYMCGDKNVSTSVLFILMSCAQCKAQRLTACSCISGSS